MTISSRWFAGTPKNKIKEFEDLVLNSGVVLGKLKHILEESRKAVIHKVREDDYDKSSSWAYKQAHRNGKLEAFDQIYELLKHLDKD